jgi:nucleoside-diphosphate-sugar epimerase
VKWLILVHTTGIYSKYKAAGEGYREIEREVAEIAATSHISLTILRPTMIYGSLKDKNIAVFIKMVDKLSLFPVVDHARYLLQPVHEKDLGKAYYQVLKNKSVTMGKSYTLSGKSPILLIDILRTIEKILNKKNLYLSIPFSVAYGGAVMLHILTLGKIDYREKVQRLVEPRAYPHDEAQRDFGYSPLTFEEGVLNEIKEYLEKTKPAKLAR